MKKMLLMGAVMAAGLLFTGNPAQAAGQGIVIDVPGTTATDLGTWHVTLTNIVGNTWQITVKGNNDGATQNVGRVGLTLYSDTAATSPLTVASANNGASAGPGGGGAWNSAFIEPDSPFGVSFTTSTAAFRVRKEGDNTFTSTFTMSSSSPIRAADIFLQDTHQQWRADGVVIPPPPPNVAPEPASLALALPGLLPLASLLRRRRNSGSQDANEEETA
jgi:hypothetical protein